MKLSLLTITAILAGFCALSTATSNTIQVDSSIRRVSELAQVFLAQVSIDDLFNAPHIAVSGVAENGGFLVYTKARSKKLKFEDGTEDILWLGATENTEGFATLRQQGLTGRFSGTVQTPEATFEIVELQDGTVELRKVDWKEFNDEADEIYAAGDDSPDVVENEFPITDAMLVQPAASVESEISLGDSTSILPVSRLLRSDPRRVQVNIQIDLLVVVTKYVLRNPFGIIDFSRLRYTQHGNV